MRQNKRWFTRFSVRQGVQAILSSEQNGIIQGSPIDISSAGAYIAGISTNVGNAKIHFQIPDALSCNPLEIARDCYVYPNRSGRSGGCAIKFYTPLTNRELAELSEVPHVCGSLELAMEDYKLVNEEVSGIQSCRTQMFIGSIAAMSAWIIATVGIGLVNKVQPSLWVLIGSSFPYFILTISILGTIEKTNAVNLRRGFLAALVEYLRSDALPPNYIGWAQLKLNRSECRSRFSNDLCPSKGNACWAGAITFSENLTKGHHIIRGTNRGRSSIYKLTAELKADRW